MDLSETMLANWKPWIIVAHDPIYRDFGELTLSFLDCFNGAKEHVKERTRFETLLERGGKYFVRQAQIVKNLFIFKWNELKWIYINIFFKKDN